MGYKLFHFSIITRLILTHESSWIVGICSNFAIDLDQPLFNDTFDLVSSESILETVPKEHNERDALSLLVWSRRRLWRLQ